MLEIIIPGKELYDEIKEEFVYTKPCTLRLEHSLVSLSKWEANNKKPFLYKKEGLTREEQIDYIRCMTITQNVSDDVYYSLSNKQIKEIFQYVDDPRTATWFSVNKEKASSNREVLTSEVIYYWMCEYNIDWKAEKWHLSRLLTLIRVCGAKKRSSEKMSNKEIMKQNNEVNKLRRKASHSSG